MFYIKFKFTNKQLNEDSSLPAMEETQAEAVYWCDYYTVYNEKDESGDIIPSITGSFYDGVTPNWGQRVISHAFIMNKDGVTIDKVHATIYPKSEGSVNC